MNLLQKMSLILGLWAATACSPPAAAPAGDAEADLATSVDVCAGSACGIDVAEVNINDGGAEVGADVAPDVPPKPDIVPDVPAELPMPATVPGDLPPGVTAQGLTAAKFSDQGKSPNLLVKMPVGTVSFLGVVIGVHPNFYGLGKIVTPSGDLWAKDKCVDALCITCVNRLGFSPGVGAALIPSTSGLKVTGGQWNLGSCAFVWQLLGSTFAPVLAKGVVEETVVFIKTTIDGKLPSTGELHLRFWLTGAGKLDQNTALADPRIVGMLKEIAMLYATMGIVVKVVDLRQTAPGHTVITLPDDTTTTGASDMDLLFAEAKSAGGSAVVDVFFVSQIIGGGMEGKGIVGGIAGGIPGPAFYHGIARSGVVVALGAMGDNGQLLGRVLAHEIGHFMGLWHPSEATGNPHDPIDDTPQCGAAQDINGDNVLSVDECQDHGADNIMFWFAGNKVSQFTPGQGLIVRGNPLVLPSAASATNP